MLIPKWSQKWSPKPSKIIQKSVLNRIWSETRDFLKNSTSPTRELHFWGSWVLKKVPKLIKNGPGTIQNPIEILIEVWIDFSLILVPFWLPKLVQNGSKDDPKNLSEKRPKNHWKMDPKLIPKMERHRRTSRLMFGLFFGSGFSWVPRAPQVPKMNDLGSQNASKID